MLAICMLFMIPAAAQQNEDALGPMPPWMDDLLDRLGYFPLEAGNEWVFSEGGNSYRVEVLRQTTEANGRTYYAVAGYFPNDSVRVRKLRRDLTGQVFEYNPGGEDFLWYRLPLVGSLSWRPQSGQEIPCWTGSTAVARRQNQSVQVPAGTFNNVIRVEYRNQCADGGILQEHFAPGVGLVKRVNNSIAGPRNMELISARIGDQSYPNAAFSVELGIDRAVYFNNRMPPIPNPPRVPTMQATLVVRNDTDTPIELSFASSRRFDFVLRDRKGNEILRWSEDRKFLPALGREIIRKGDRLVYTVAIELRDRYDQILPAGYYTLEGYLTTIEVTGGMQPLGASVRFELKDVF